jgi:hypothetical protein
MQAETRYKRRVPCELTHQGARHPGLVLNVSRGGLFVQTGARALPGSRVRVALSPGRGDPSIALETRVVWKRIASPRLQSFVHGGVGLCIQSAPEAWYGFLARVAEPGSTAAARPPAAASRQAPPRQAAPLPRHRVRVGQRGGPRSRVLVVEAASPDEARRRALACSGAGWVVLDIETA